MRLCLNSLIYIVDSLTSDSWLTALQLLPECLKEHSSLLAPKSTRQQCSTVLGSILNSEISDNKHKKMKKAVLKLEHKETLVTV